MTCWIASIAKPMSSRVTARPFRYPSLTRFMVWLEQLRQQDQDAPDQPPGQGEQDRVRLLTVHEAKGLEAPVVFVADASRESPPERGARILVEWPAGCAVPQHFLLSPGGKFPNAYCESVIARLQQKDEQEDANLLYVALTRAEQYLYISASNKAKGWYDEICRVYAIDNPNETDKHCLGEAGIAPDQIPETRPDKRANFRIDAALQHIISLPPSHQEIAPSYTVDWQGTHQTVIDEDARERGIVIHVMLDALAQEPDLSLAQVQPRFNHLAARQLEQYWQEAQTVINSFPELFATGRFERAYSEVPVIYSEAGRTVYGIIDRLVCYADGVVIVDYKSHRLHSEQDTAQACLPYREQLRLYANGIRSIFTDKPVICRILFTALPKCVDMPA